VVIVADDLGAWLVALLAEAGRKRLTTWVLGTDQERALRQAGTAALQLTAIQFAQSDGQRANELARVVGEVFRGPKPDTALAGQTTLLQALHAGIAANLAVLDDPTLTGTGESSAEVLGVPGSVLAETLARHLTQEIMLRGSGGGPLAPLADQLNHDVTHLQGQRIEGAIAQLASQVEALARSEPVVWPVRVGNVPQQPPAWQPREQLLAAVGKLGPSVPIVRAITGMRGTGKTQVAAAYARSRMAAGWRLVAWVNAQDTDAALRGLGDIALKLGVRTHGVDLLSAAAEVRHWLEAFGEQCLVVFDDAGDVDMLQQFVPAAGDAQVVITSSLQEAADLGLPVPVGVFTQDEALAFLGQRTHNVDASAARDLAAELGYLPLALAQAAAVIRRQRLSYASYLERLRALPVSEYLTRAKPDPYPRGTAAAVLLSMDSAGARDRSTLPGTILDLIAVLSVTGVNRNLLYLAGENGALHRAMDANELPTAVDAALAQLADASLLTYSMDGSAVSTHSLVMRVIRELRTQEGSLAATGMVAASVLFAMSASVDPVWQHPDAARDLIQQSMALYTQVAPLLTEADGDVLVKLLRLRAGAVKRLTELGDRPTLEIEYIQSLLADYEQFLGADHPGTVHMRSDLAGAYQRAGRTADAILLSERALADYERILGPWHLGTAAARNNLALAYQAAGRADEAIPLLERTLIQRESALGENHADTLIARNNLAYAYQAADRADEAIPLFEHTLAERERALGENHPDTLLSRSNLAACYQAAGRTGEAIPMYERTLIGQDGLFRGDHPDTLAARNNLAGAYQAVGRRDEAISLYQRTLADCERVLGADHPNTRGVWEALEAIRQGRK
jgi:tetratricopeptide (TPR) repeat protein